MSKSTSIAAFQATALADIDAKINTCQATFRSQKTKDIQWRLVQLRKLYWGLVDNTPLFEEALQHDMNKCKYETHLTELEWCKMECLDLINNLEKWAQDEPVVNVPMQYWPMKFRIRNEPLGTILVIGAYNYPIMLNIVPVAGAIAAGNTVVLKPSEHAPHAAMALKKLFDDVLDPDCATIINGAVPETKQVLEAKFDKIVFTGGKKTGTIIAQKAAETLTPVLLELGGRNPAFISRNANIKMAARRVMWQKCLNAGQVCLSHNYVLVERPVLSDFIGEINKQYRVMMPKGAKASPDYSRIVNKGHYDRIKKMLDDSRGKIVMGGTVDESELFIEPTAVLVDDHHDSMVVDESFGPIWSIIPIDSLDQGIKIANEVDPTPLALFTFGTDAENDKVMRSVTSGGATANDAFLHAATNAPPFGGVGSSGTGSYRGYYSFKSLSHQRTIAKVPYWADAVLRVRYMPYSWGEMKRMALLNPKPNFDRNGNVSRGLKYWLGYLFGLGSVNSSGAAIRWGIFLLLIVGLGLKRNSLGL